MSYHGQYVFRLLAIWRLASKPLKWIRQADVAQLVEQLIRNQ